MVCTHTGGPATTYNGGPLYACGRAATLFVYDIMGCTKVSKEKGNDIIYIFVSKSLIISLK